MFCVVFTMFVVIYITQWEIFKRQYQTSAYCKKSYTHWLLGRSKKELIYCYVWRNDHKRWELKIKIIPVFFKTLVIAKHNTVFFKYFTKSYILRNIILLGMRETPGKRKLIKVTSCRKKCQYVYYMYIQNSFPFRYDINW